MPHDEAKTGWSQIHVRNGPTARAMHRSTCTAEITYIKDALRIHTSDLCSSIGIFLSSKTEESTEWARLQIEVAYNPQALTENFRVQFALATDSINGKIYATYRRINNSRKWTWNTSDDLGAWALYIAHIDLELPEDERMIFAHVHENKVRHRTCFKVDFRERCLDFTGTVEAVKVEEYTKLRRIRKGKSRKK